MQLHQIREIIHNFEPTDENTLLDLQVHAAYSGNVSGFILLVKLNGVSVMVSSKREKRRVFKSLDGLKKTLNQHDIHTFSVSG